MTRRLDSFEIVQEVEIAAPRERVWECLLGVEGWWLFRVGGKGNPVVLEPRVGGRFYERFDDHDQGALWGTVTQVRRPELLALEGLLGMDGAVVSAYEYELEGRGTGTRLRLTHRVAGLLDPAWKDSHTGGWAKLLRALGEYVARPKG